MFDHESGVAVLMGSSRSGTTLTRFLCESHSEILCSTEPSPQKILALRSLPTGKRVALICANHYLDALPLATPHKHRIVTTFRNPVDVVSSMSKLENGPRAASIPPEMAQVWLLGNNEMDKC